jgi:Raf kinase inhibitor-like YbhB/YbcL family protein
MVSSQGGMPMRLVSKAFDDGAAIPQRHTCDGEDLSPPLEWSGAPPGTRSFVVLCDDPDAPRGTWHHWAAYDLPPSLTGLGEGAGGERAAGFRQATTDFGRPGYGGPCPPKGNGPHHYRFRLLALSVDRLPVRAHPGYRDVEREAQKHVLAEAKLVGLYER